MNKKNIENDYQKLKSRLIELWHLGTIAGLLDWDKQVLMPKNGAALRAATFSYLAGMMHQKFLEIDRDGTLTRLRSALKKKRLDTEQSTVVREVIRSFDRESKLPQNFVQELSEVISHSYTVWEEAKKSGDFNIFAPHLKKIIELKRKEAKLLGYKDSPYNALLDQFEPGMSVKQLIPLFDELKEFLIDLIQKIQKSKKKINPKIIYGDFDLKKQAEFSHMITAKMGFNHDAGRIDVSTHPFAIGLSANDVRITTRYQKHDVINSVSSTMHEGGHALYEQGLPEQHFGTALAESVSLGIHESQSRLWENIVGKSKSFWKYFYPKLQKEFPKPFKRLKFEAFYDAINNVRPSLIRIESDEVTYNLHIIIRFEIERALLEGQIEVEDLPEIWNAKYKEYLGVTVPGNSQGVLQDVHWSSGAIGYFPTYTLGNLYSAQFYAAASRQIPELKKHFERGDFSKLLAWLRKHIHVHGKKFSAAQLVKKATGEALDTKYYKQYLTEKYSKIYELSEKN